MKKMIVFLMATVLTYAGPAQYQLKVQLKNSKTGEPVPGVSVVFDTKGTSTDSAGFAMLNNVPAGKHKIRFSHTGYETRTELYSFPLASDERIKILF